ncbi:MAG: metalloregulator ArsR/SmtB family transcription factor [Anaerovoracaceae bacterium]|nr:metalloregulator ArsR/SmtB family transcription factor [Bacillota bacterium]MDY2671109.1 metalloregulator ArsR/SmtB family transcription factor [Anaerovoracaceae bacterium]
MQEQSKISDIDVCDELCIHEDKLKIVTENTPSDEELYDLAEFFKIFADSTRVRILFVLFETPLCVCDLAEALHMKQPAVSYQLRILKQARLVKSRREGRTVYYSLSDDHVRGIIEMGREHLTEKHQEELS